MTDTVEKKPKKVKKYIVSSIRFVIQFCFIVFFLLIILFFALYARILWKPIDLVFLDRLFEYVVSDDKFDIKIENPAIIHNYDVGLLGVHVDTVTIYNIEKKQEYTLNDIVLDISKTSILKQHIGVNSITVDSIKLSQIDMDNGQSTDMNIQKTLDDILNNPILAPFKKLTINRIDAIINIPPSDTVSLDTVVNMNISDLTFQRQYEFFNNRPIYDLYCDVAIDNMPFKIKSASGHLQTFYNTRNQDIIVRLKDFKSNLGDIFFADTSINLDNGYFDMRAKTDNIHDGYFYDTPIGLKSLALQGNFNKHTHLVDVQNYQFSFDDFVSIKGTATIDLTQDLSNFSYHFNAHIDHLTIPSLLRLWPKKAAVGAREWVVYNLKKSLFGATIFNIAGNNTDAYPTEISLIAPITDASFSYLSPMIPATQVNGRLIIDNKEFTAMVDTGMIDVLAVKNTSFKILDIFNPTPTGQIEANLNGALKPLLTLIDSKPLGLMSKGGFGYNQTVGDFSATLTMQVPLLRDVKLSDITLKTNVKVTNGALTVGSKKLPLQNINANLQLTPNIADGTGSASLYGIKSTFKWHENFDAKSPITTDLTLKTPIINEQQTEELITNLVGHSINIPYYTRGDARLETQLHLQNGSIRSLNIQGDISDMSVGYGDTMWRFNAASSKNLTIIASQKDSDFHVKKFSITHFDDIFQLSDIYINNTGIQSAKIDAINFKDIIRGMSGCYYKKDNRHYTDLNASKFFMQPIIDDAYKDTKTASEMFKYPNLFMRFKVKKLQKDDMLLIGDADILASRHEDNPHQIYLDIEAPTFDKTKIQITETGIETRQINVQSLNAGRLLKSFGIFDNVKGGDLTIDMVQKSGVFTGKTIIKDGKFFKSPLMAKLLSFASLSAIVDRLNNRGLSFDRASVDFQKIDNMIDFKNGTIHGSAIGMSFQGKYNLNEQNINIYGTLVPFYGLNSALSNIPIVGQIISSRDTEGLIGMSYKIKGKTDKPQISMNPLSILTVGILRRIFEE